MNNNYTINTHNPYIIITVIIAVHNRIPFHPTFRLQRGAFISFTALTLVLHIHDALYMPQLLCSFWSQFERPCMALRLRQFIISDVVLGVYCLLEVFVPPSGFIGRNINVLRIIVEVTEISHMGHLGEREKDMGIWLWNLTLKRLGGPKRPPLDISHDYTATRKALAATLYDFFLSSSPHILTPNLLWSYVTFCTCTSDRKWLQNVILILCTKSMQIEFFSHSSYKYAYFYSQWLKWICFSIIVLQEVSATNFTEKTTKTKGQKTKKYIRNS